MSLKSSLLAAIAVCLMAVPAQARGPKGEKKQKPTAGYSGQGAPRPLPTSQQPTRASRIPTQPTARTPARQTLPAASPMQNSARSPSRDRYSKKRPSYTQNRIPQPQTGARPVQLPNRPTYGRPPGATQLPSQPHMTNSPQPPVVFYPKRKQRKPGPGSVAVHGGPTTLPSRPPRPDTNPPGGGYHSSLRPSYPRRPTYPPRAGTAVQQPAVSSPTIIQNQVFNNQTFTNQTINNQTTNIINNQGNVNQWLQNNAWQNRVAINSQHWNGRPWWYQQDYGDWHHGNWHGRYYFRGRDAWNHVDSDDAPWLSGLVSWGLGNLVYRSGYQAYANPYFVQPIVLGSTTINYSQPICVQHSNYENAYVSDEALADQLRNQALDEFDAARRAFLEGDYPRALRRVDQAIALLPDDTSLHEFRALALFALEQYQPSAEAIHAVLAVAPGWDWTTLSGLYSNHDTYLAQLRRLENHVRNHPREAGARFLLAYHYITMGYPESAAPQLRAVVALMPSDQLSADLLALVTDSPDRDASIDPVGAASIPTAQLRGKWQAMRPRGVVELEFNEGRFLWDYTYQGSRERWRGRYLVSQNLLVMASDSGSQMVGSIRFEDRDAFVFRLVGSSSSDSGARFERLPQRN